MNFINKIKLTIVKNYVHGLVCKSVHDSDDVEKMLLFEKFLSQIVTLLIMNKLDEIIGNNYLESCAKSILPNRIDYSVKNIVYCALKELRKTSNGIWEKIRWEENNLEYKGPLGTYNISLKKSGKQNGYTIYVHMYDNIRTSEYLEYHDAIYSFYKKAAKLDHLYRRHKEIPLRAYAYV